MDYSSDVSHDTPVDLGVPRLAAGSLSDLYPRVATMQRMLDARGFAVVTAKAATAINPGALTVLLQTPDDGDSGGCEALLSAHSEPLLTHLWSSPLPLRIDAVSLKPVVLGPPAAAVAAPGQSRCGYAFPVQLGAMGNGYAVIFGASTEMTSNLLVDLHRRAVAILREALKLEFSAVAAIDTLNDREIECLQMVGDGYKSEAIGEKLNLSVHTVNAYLSAATAKLDAVNRIQAIAKAIRLGLIA